MPQNMTCFPSYCKFHLMCCSSLSSIYEQNSGQLLQHPLKFWIKSLPRCGIIDSINSCDMHIPIDRSSPYELEVKQQFLVPSLQNWLDKFSLSATFNVQSSKSLAWIFTRWLPVIPLDIWHWLWSNRCDNASHTLMICAWSGIKLSLSFCTKLFSIGPNFFQLITWCNGKEGFSVLKLYMGPRRHSSMFHQCPYCKET